MPQKSRLLQINPKYENTGAIFVWSYLCVFWSLEHALLVSCSWSNSTVSFSVSIPTATQAPHAHKKMSESEGKRVNRALTQKYDMHQLRALQKLEEEFMAVICPIYNCDEDTLPVVVDLLKIFNEPAAHRREHLVELLSKAPSDVTSVIDRIVSDMARIDIEHQEHEHAQESKK